MLERQKERLKKLKRNKESNLEKVIVEIVYIIFFIAYNLFEIYVVYLIGKYLDKVLATIFICLCFFSNKAMFGTPLHFSNNLVCFGLSTILFYTAISLTPNISISIFGSIFMGVLCGGTTSYIATYLTAKRLKRDIGEEIRSLNLTQKQMEIICYKHGIDREIIEIIKYRAEHSEKETYMRFHMDRSTLNRKINKFLEKIVR